MGDYRRREQTLVDLAENLAGSHEGNPSSVVGMGIGVALCLAVYGVVCMVTQEAIFLGSRPLQIVKYTDTPAICLGAIFLSVGLFLHFHFAWANAFHFYWIGQLGKLLSAAACVLALGYWGYYFLLIS